jgi:hypothetical protein
MSDKPYVVGGLILFLVFVTTPIWRGVATRKTVLATPQIALPAKEKRCVAQVSYMRTSHMQLLDQWRDSVVRGQRRQYVTDDGRVYEKSLTQTCLSQCHGSRMDFCERCHSYSGVTELDCWSCHSDAAVAIRNMP